MDKAVFRPKHPMGNKNFKKKITKNLPKAPIPTKAAEGNGKSCIVEEVLERDENSTAVAGVRWKCSATSTEASGSGNEERL